MKYDEEDLYVGNAYSDDNMQIHHLHIATLKKREFVREGSGAQIKRIRRMHLNGMSYNLPFFIHLSIL